MKCPNPNLKDESPCGACELGRLSLLHLYPGIAHRHGGFAAFWPGKAGEKIWSKVIEIPRARSWWAYVICMAANGFVYPGSEERDVRIDSI